MSKNFLDRFKKPSASSNNSNGNSNNPFAGWFGNNSSNSNASSFGGTGQSLGGSQPGRVLPIELSEAGPLGIHIEKRPDSATAVVQYVMEGSPAQRAGLQRGDVLCFAGSNGQEEILYDMFVELAKSTQRPLCLEVRRVPQTRAAAAVAAAPSQQKHHQQQQQQQSQVKSSASADAYARRQAVIAAAEQREREHKKKVKPLPKKDLSNLLQPPKQNNRDSEADQPLSEATEQARIAAKTAEQQTAAALGYNPYETKRLTAGQARNAVNNPPVPTSSQQSAHSSSQPSSQQHQQHYDNRTIPNVAEPSDLLVEQELPEEFQHAFETLVTANADHAAVLNSLSVLRKLVINATTKGQQQHDNNKNDNKSTSDDNEKFRKIRLANPKIAAAVTDMVGAVDVLLCIGFTLWHDDATNESLLVYPIQPVTPSWLPAALQLMERYQ